MADSAALVRLMSWMSPAFPVGAFAYSHGLERAIHDGLVIDRETLVEWLTDLVEAGSGWNDAVLLAEAWRRASAGDDIAEIAELAEAMAGSQERHMETTHQGSGFSQAVAAWHSQKDISASVAYPVAVGTPAARHGIPLEDALAAYLHSFTSNLIQVAVRLVPLGQQNGVAAVAELEPILLEAAHRAAATTLDDLGSCTFVSEIAAMKHETQQTRLFRS